MRDEVHETSLNHQRKRCSRLGAQKICVSVRNRSQGCHPHHHGHRLRFGKERLPWHCAIWNYSWRFVQIDISKWCDNQKNCKFSTQLLNSIGHKAIANASFLWYYNPREAIIRAAATVRCSRTITANVGFISKTCLQTRNKPPLRQIQYIFLHRYLQADFIVARSYCVKKRWKLFLARRHGSNAPCALLLWPFVWCRVNAKSIISWWCLKTWKIINKWVFSKCSHTSVSQQSLVLL